MTATAKLPIGVFDSGVGGLTVVRALMERLPLESILYFGDTARVPYGVKSVATIEAFTAQITDYLLEQGVKMLIIACNTMAAVASHVVKERARGIPVLDVIEAGARAAVQESPARAIGVIGTPTTIDSNAYARRIHALDPNVRVYSQACPLFVPLVEEAYFLACLKSTLEHDATRALLALLRTAEWQRRLAQLPGYVPMHSGEVLSMSRVLPWWRFGGRGGERKGNQ